MVVVPMGYASGMSEGRQELTRFLDRHRRLFVLTGAGCSAPSGIPDYRDVEGAWKHSKPMTFSEFTGSASARQRYWAGSLRGWPRVRDARPNPAHVALARLEGEGRIQCLVTQNVDGLHRRAGSRRLVELHGRLDTVECLDCGACIAREDVQALLLGWNADHGDHGDLRPDGDARVHASLDGFRVPECRECGGMLKPQVVFFGENVPRARVDAAFAALEESDALLVVGSSLMVYSGYRFVLAARERLRPVAVLNLGRTRADAHLTLKVVGDCAQLLSQLVGGDRADLHLASAGEPVRSRIGAIRPT
jgi:NAD-dependent SIR2 family protein deacetylase